MPLLLCQLEGQYIHAQTPPWLWCGCDMDGTGMYIISRRDADQAGCSGGIPVKHLSKLTCMLLAVLLAETPGPIPGLIDERVEIIVTGETDLPGCFFLSFPFSRNLLGLDGKGSIVWEKYEPFASPDQPGSFWDFKQHTVDGEVYYSHHDNTDTYDNDGLTGYGPGSE